MVCCILRSEHQKVPAHPDTLVCTLDLQLSYVAVIALNEIW